MVVVVMVMVMVVVVVGNRISRGKSVRVEIESVCMKNEKEWETVVAWDIRA